MRCEPVVTRGGTISLNPARVQEMPPLPARPFGAVKGGFSARGTMYLGSAATVHLGFAPFAEFDAPIHLGSAALVHIGFAPFATFSAEGVSVASV